jgi:hypothetical protein
LQSKLNPAEFRYRNSAGLNNKSPNNLYRSEIFIFKTFWSVKHPKEFLIDEYQTLKGAGTL